MKSILRYSKLPLFFLLCSSVFLSCDPQFSTPVGSGDLGDLVPDGTPVVYVAVGNSLTAGIIDAALFRSGQMYSFPYLLAQQLGISDFAQPWIDDPGIGNRRYLRGFTQYGEPIIETVEVRSQPAAADLPRPYNNLGIPGAVLYDAIDTSDFALRGQERGNPFYEIILRSPLFGKSMIEQALSLNPNFITLWLGNNDVLGYATSGGTKGTAGTPGNPQPTDPQVFHALYAQILQQITTTLPEAKIIVFTIPDVAAIPFFTTIPWNALVIMDQQQVDMLNAAYAQYGFHFQLGPNGFIAESRSSAGGLRQLTENDLVLLSLPRDSITQAGWGSIKPIPDQYVLDSIEISTVRQHIALYNQSIIALTQQFSNVYLLDAYQIFEDVKANGYFVPGSNPMTTSYIAGSFFSLDGIHPTPKGYGVIANEVIKLLNKQFGADIPLVPIQNLPAIRVVPQ